MKIAIIREPAGETRVAATPETVGKLIGLGAAVAVESGAGNGARITDEQFKVAGANVVPDAAGALKGADVVLTVRRPPASALTGVTPGALVIGMLDPYGSEGEIAELAG